MAFRCPFPSTSKNSSSTSTSYNSPSSKLKEKNSFSDLQQSIDDWQILKHPQDQIYKAPSRWRSLTSDYHISTVEQTIPLESDHEDIKLLNPRTIERRKHKHNYLHFGLVQIASKPLSREDLDTSLLLCLRDSRFLDFNDSLLGMVETSLCNGLIYFDCFSNFIVSLKDLNILDSLTLNVKTSNYKTKSESLPVAVIYRVQYKAMNTAFSSGAMKCSYKGETVLFQTDLQRSHLSVPKPISWNQVSLPQSWTLQDATPADKPENTAVSQIRQFSTGTSSISFQRSLSQWVSGSPSVLPEIQMARNLVFSFPSRIETVNLESRIPQAKYSVETPLTEIHDDPPQSPIYSALGAELGILSQDFHIDKKTLGTKFYSSGNFLKRTCFFNNFMKDKRKNIQEIYHAFLNSVQKQINFFAWFEAYIEYHQLDFPFSKSINVSKIWKTLNGANITAELPPSQGFTISHANNSIVVLPFKRKADNEPVTGKDIKSLFEQNNYTNKYLHTLGEYLTSK
ncbi:hypothetical protein CQW23_08037 [Capsicum baccatum]|uniref:DUF7588 domain-containing protein n=1 Tax=Capsicum baccatum TaxID=33114 RepID=A0A2G2X7U6_CAPBA|nr:hypothetical protein CQW23_08037 [Capsicum baccatum]